MGPSPGSPARREPQRRTGGVGEFGRGDPARDDHARARDAGGNEPHRRPRPAQTTHLLAVNAGEQADPAVRLLLAAEGEVVLRDVDVELAQEVGERGKRQPRADEQPDERPQQARNRRLQALRRPAGGASSVIAPILSHPIVGLNPTNGAISLTWEFFPRTEALQRSGISIHGYVRRRRHAAAPIRNSLPSPRAPPLRRGRGGRPRRLARRARLVVGFGPRTSRRASRSRRRRGPIGARPTAWEQARRACSPPRRATSTEGAHVR